MGDTIICERLQSMSDLDHSEVNCMSINGGERSRSIERRKVEFSGGEQTMTGGTRARER